MDRKVFQEAADFISSRSPLSPRIALVLGSGLNPLAERMEQSAVIPFTDIPHFPPTTVEGHVGRMIVGTLDGVPVLVMQGRYHFYEGYTMKQVVLPIRVMKALGVEVVILTNSAGAINLDYRPGDMMLISDHIYIPGMAGNNPLMGPNDDDLGPRFPDMSRAYDRHLREMTRRIAREEGPPLHEGIYASVAGPSFETPAEVRFLRIIGADAVGMSTAPETVVAVHSGMKVLGISGISNAAPGVLPSETSHEEVLAAGKVLVPRMIALLRRVVPAIAREMGK
jgi:purine-nucleoside phosphorylase